MDQDMSEEKNNQQAPEMELSEILQVRRDKLAALQQEGWVGAGAALQSSLFHGQLR